jgi:hypothetical protein
MLFFRHKLRRGEIVDPPFKAQAFSVYLLNLILSLISLINSLEKRVKKNTFYATGAGVTVINDSSKISREVSMESYC